MTAVSALPALGDAFFDRRDDGRSLRVSWHGTGELCVLSIWRDGRCVASFQLDRPDAVELIDSLARGLAG